MLTIPGRCDRLRNQRLLFAIPRCPFCVLFTRKILFVCRVGVDSVERKLLAQYFLPFGLISILCERRFDTQDISFLCFFGIRFRFRLRGRAYFRIGRLQRCGERVEVGAVPKVDGLAYSLMTLSLEIFGFGNFLTICVKGT